MWNLTGNDIARAKEELKGRRAAIQARYENELKQFEVDIADLETFERFAVKFVADFKGEEPPPAVAVAEPTPEVAASAEAVHVVEPDNAANLVLADVPGDKVEAAASVDTGARKGASRWRMHLGAGEVSA